MISYHHLPRYDQRKEWESNLHEIRVSRGMTYGDLAKAAGILASQIWPLANGTVAPVYEVGGEIKPVAEKIAQALDCELADIWPRYFCPIQQYAKIGDREVTEMSIGEQSLLAAMPLEDLVILREDRYCDMEKLMCNLLPREREVINLRFGREGETESTLEDIATKFSISRERVRQIERKALRRIKWQIDHKKELSP